MSNNKLSTIHCLGMEDALSTAKMVWIESKGAKEGIPGQANGEWVVEVFEAEK